MGPALGCVDVVSGSRPKRAAVAARAAARAPSSGLGGGGSGSGGRVCERVNACVCEIVGVRERAREVRECARVCECDRHGGRSV